MNPGHQQPAALQNKVVVVVLCRLAGELAAREAKGPGSLRVGLLDRLWTLGEAEVLAGVKLTEGYQ